MAAGLLENRTNTYFIERNVTSVTETVTMYDKHRYVTVDEYVIDYNNYTRNGGVDLPNVSVNVNITSPDSYLNDVIHVDTIRARQIDDYLWIYFSPVIFILGLCGNALTLAVMSRKRLRGSTTSVYMPAMAAFDTIALTVGILPEWLRACDIVVFRELHPITCKLEKFVFYTASDIAIWILVLFTFDRFVAVCFPLWKTRICVPRRSKIACVVVFGCAVVKNLHVFWTRGAEYDGDGKLLMNCGRPEPYTFFETVPRPWIVFVLISLVPFLVLAVCNSAIIWVLTKTAGHATVTLRTDTRRTAAGQGQGQGGQVQGRKRSGTFKQTTMMCLSASFVFLVCVIPSIVMLIGKPYWTKQDNYSYDVAKAVNNQLAYFNHSINFFLYCLTGQKFRSELLSLVRQVRLSLALSDDTHLFGTIGSRHTYVIDAISRHSGATAVPGAFVRAVNSQAVDAATPSTSRGPNVKTEISSAI